jgi:hypothetical protein
MGKVVFEESSHTYRDADGPLHSVSKICASLGDEFKYVKKDVLEYAATRGTHVHSACELFDKGTLDFDSLDEVIKPYVEGYINFIEQSNFEVLYVEKQIVDHVRRFAGRLDRVGKVGNQWYVLDIKTAGSLSPTVGLQLAAYQSCLSPIPYKRVALHLKKDGTYRLVEYPDPNDLAVFYAALLVYKWKESYGKT